MNPFLPQEVQEPETQEVNPFLPQEFQEPETQEVNPFLPQEDIHQQSTEHAPGTWDYAKNAPSGGPSFDEASQGFWDKVDILNHGFESYALGGQQLLNAGVRKTLGNLPGSAGQYFVDTANQADAEVNALKQASDTRYNEAYTRTPSPIVDFLGSAGGATVASLPAILATTTAGAPTAGAIIGQGALAGASAGAVDYADSLGERAMKTGFGAALGGAVPATIIGTSKILQAIAPKIGASSFVTKFFNPEKAAVEDTAHAIKTDSPNLVNLPMEMDDTLTMGEQMGKGQGQAGTLRALEGSIKASPEEKLAVSKGIVDTANQVKQGIYDSIDNMAPAEVYAAEKEAYKPLTQEFVGPDGKLLGEGPPVSLNYTPEFIQNNKVLSEKLAEVKTSSSDKYSGLPDNSIAQLHKIEEAIKDSLTKAQPDKKGNILKDLSPAKKAELMDAQQIIRPILEQSEQFNTAMNLTRRIKLQEYYQGKLGLKKANAGMKGDLTVEQIFDSVLPQKFLQDKFIKDVVSTGGDAQVAKKLVQALDNLRLSPRWNIIKDAADRGITTEKSWIGGIKDFIENVTLSRYHKALLDVMMNHSKYTGQINDILKMPMGSLGQKKALVSLLGNIMVADKAKDMQQNGNVNDPPPQSSANEDVSPPQPQSVEDKFTVDQEGQKVPISKLGIGG